jgi:hypothetical protein
MAQSHIDEFSQLQDEAVLHLREGVDRPGYVRKAQVLVLPSFADCRAYAIMLSGRPADDCRPGRSIHSSPNADSALVVRTTWRKLTDLEKFRTPVTRLKHGVGVRLKPTMEEIDVTLAAEQVADLLSRAAALAVPPHIQNSSFGVDGTSYGLVLGGPFAQARFEWWCDPPAGWEPLAALLWEIETLAEAAIKASHNA